MSPLAASGSMLPSPRGKTPYFAGKLVASGVILAAAVAFVFKYVFRYYLHYSAAAYTDPLLGAPNYWTMRGWLLMHISGGMAALLTGPFQFWTGFRIRYVN